MRKYNIYYSLIRGKGKMQFSDQFRSWQEAYFTMTRRLRQMGFEITSTEQLPGEKLIMRGHNIDYPKIKLLLTGQRGPQLGNIIVGPGKHIDIATALSQLD